MAIRKAKVAVLGVGYSKITRGEEDRTLGDDAIKACTNAIIDAGLQIQDIDGITSYPNRADGVATASDDGFFTVTPHYIWRRLKIPNLRWGEVNQKFVGSSIIEAHNAIAGGACRYALVWRAVNFPRGQRYRQSGTDTVDSAEGGNQFSFPYGAVGGPMQFALVARRYFDKYGATREHFATFVVANRKHALLNEKGYWATNRPEVITRQDYLGARMIADPLSLYDCDIPVQGCAAWVLGPTEAAQDLPHRAAFILGYAQGYRGPGGGPQTFSHGGGRSPKPTLEDNQEMGARLAHHLWEVTGVGPADIATANLYDGFSIIPLLWLEALGFCREGEAHQFIQDGRIEIGGKLPLNTSGGNLGEGRLHGSTHISEAVLQAMGRAGPRQVKHVRYTLAAVDQPTVGQAIVFSSEPD